MQVETKTGLEWLTFPFLLESNARRYPNKEAVVDYTYNKRFTYREAWLRSNRVANALLNLGVKDGDKVAYLCYNVEEAFHIIFGVTSIRALFVPLNFRLMLHQWVAEVNHSDAVVLICQDSLCGQIDPGRADIPKVKHYIAFGENVPPNWLNFEELLAKASDEAPAVEVRHNDLASVSYTAGTTGEPKGVLNTHSSWIGYGLGQAMCLRLGPDAKCWTFMDMIHRGGIYTTMSAMVVGGTVVYLERLDASKSFQMIYREKVNAIYGAFAFMWAALPEDERSKYDMSHMKHFWVGAPTWSPAWGGFAGASATTILPQEMLNQLRTLFPNVEYDGSFLSTEGQFTLLSMAEMWALPTGDAWEGQAHHGTQLMITDLEGKKELSDGESGLIWSRGMGSLDGFYKGKELEETMMKPGGWFTSEDMGYIDPKSKMLVFTGRAKDIVRSGGENVPVVPVELAIKENPKIANCGVIGTPHPQLGETVTAVVELKPGETMTEEELIEYCRPKLPGPWRPRRVEFVEKMPIVGFKEMVDKKLLKAQLAKKYKG